ncbi:MAG: M15 family metallopeptidase, partial [Ornithinimicrobium sp.]
MGLPPAERRAQGRVRRSPAIDGQPRRGSSSLSNGSDVLASGVRRLAPDSTWSPGSQILKAQRVVGNRAIAARLAPVVARQSEGAAQPEPTVDVVAAVTHRLTRMFDSEGWALRWGRGPRRALSGLLSHPERIGGTAEVAAAVAALGRRERRSLSREVRQQTETWLEQAKATLRVEVQTKIEAALSERFAELARYASTADAGGPTTQFPLAFKYLIRNGVQPQLKAPTTRVRPGSSVPHSSIAGVARNDPVFPDLHAAALVADLLRLPARRDRLVMLDAIILSAISWASPYFATTGVTSSGIEGEWAALGGNLKSNIEGDLAGYVSVRTGLLNAFGDPSAPGPALAAASAYYDALVPANFLAGESGGTGTLVHPMMHAALASAEQLMTDRGSHEQVAANVERYWSTNVRENRNSPSRLSQHSYGFAVDINPQNNPNLSSSADKRFIQDMSGHDVFYAGASSRPSALSTRMRASTDTDDLQADAAAVNAASQAYQAVFADAASLRARLTAILRGRGFPGTAVEMTALLDQAEGAVRLMASRERDARTRRAEKRRGRSELEEIRTSLAESLWSSHASAAVAPAEGLTADIVTALARRVRSSDALDQLQAGLKEIIVDPARRVTSAE